jgi:hypothetical protein
VTTSLDYRVGAIETNFHGNRNVIINGAMQIAQRGTSVTGITATGYFTADRWFKQAGSLGTWTQTVENDAPTGSGFRKSLKMLCTTADASPAADDALFIGQLIEGQNIQHFLKGTASAKQFTLSFWVKSNVTGTHVAQLNDADNTRVVSATYTVNSSATWEYKTITFPADTTGAFDNDNALSLRVRWWLGAGSNRTSGTLNTTWASVTTANVAVGQTNVAAATNNYWQITGVQLEAGAVATPFEFEDFGVTRAKCERYYLRIGQNGVEGNADFSPLAVGHCQSTTAARLVVYLPTTMRRFPTGITIGGSTPNVVQGTYTSLAADRANPNVVLIGLTGTGYTTNSAMVLYGNGDGTTYIEFTGAEL